MSSGTLAAIVANPRDAASAIAAGEIAIAGDPEAVSRFAQIFARAFLT
jgi:ubiquinone biosynthesis protein UbiJ